MTKVYTFYKTFALALAGSMFCLLGSVSAQNWNYLGMPNISSGSAYWQDVQVNSVGEPYVVYSDVTNVGITVKKFDGTSWNTLGVEAFNGAYAERPKIVFNDNDVPFVAFFEGPVVKVMQFDGTNWVLTGNGGLFPSTNSTLELDIAIDNNFLYLVYPDDDQVEKATLKGFDGANWITLGTAGFSSGPAGDLRLEFHNGAPYVAFVDNNTNGVNIMTYDGVSWINVGAPDFQILPGNSINADLSLAIGDNGSLYVAVGYFSNAVETLILTFNGADWVSVGNVMFPGQSVGWHGLDVAGGQLYFAYSDGDNDGKLTVQKYNGSSWETIGQPGFSDGNASFASIDVYNGLINVAFEDFGNGFGTSVVQYNDCDQNRFNLKLTVDAYPEETSWVIKNIAGETVASGGPYPNVPDQSTLDIPLCLDDDCYEFTIIDAWGDGICCDFGAGEYLLTNAAGDTLAQGASFTTSETISFCEINALPTAIIASPQGNGLNCYGSALLLDGSASVGENALQYQWEDEVGTIISTGATATVSSEGTYFLQVTDEVTMATDIDSVEVVVAGDIFINIEFDTQPQETSWQLIGDNGFFMQGGPYIGETYGSTLVIPLCLENDCYEFTIFDAGDNGICCSNIGQGAYTVTNIAGDTLAQGAQFDSLEISNFCFNNSPTAIINPLQGTEINCFFPEITLDASGSNGENALTYEWTDGISTLGTDPSLMVSDSGTYFLIVADTGNLATDTSSIQITENNTTSTLWIVPGVEPAEITCTLGFAGLWVIGGGGTDQGVSFVWSDGIEGGGHSVTSPGVYSVTMTDLGNGCTIESSVTVTENTTPPTVDLSVSSPVLDCFSAFSTLDAGGSTGQGTLTFEWTGGSTNSSIFVSEPGDYYVTVTDGVNGCSAVDSVTILENSTLPTAVIDAPSTQLDCNVSSITLDASGSTGQGTLFYDWTGGSSGPTLEVTSPGDYFVTVTDGENQCTDVTSITITESGTTDNQVMVSITFDDFPEDISWEIRDTFDVLIASGGIYPDEPDGSTLEIPLCIPDGCYDFTIIDAYGDGLLGDATYSVTDGDGDVIAAEVNFITEESTSFCLPFIPMDPDIVILTPQGTVLDCNTTEVTLDASTSTGDHPLEYIWSDESFATVGTDPVLVVNTPGTYQLQLSDLVTGATDLDFITITENTTAPVADISPSSTVLDCNVANITLDASGSTGQGALSYEWTGGSTGTTLEVTGVGEYFVTVTDAANGCSSVESITITENYTDPVANISATTTVLDCFNGLVTLDAIGSTGQGALTYEWSDGSTESFLTVSAAGVYSVTVTDSANGCSSTASETVTENFTEPTAVINSPTTQLDCNQGSITLDASASAGQGTLFYDWTGGSTDPTLEVTAAGDYSVTVTDAVNQCSSSTTITITQNMLSPAIVFFTPTDHLDCNTPSTILDASLSSGQGTLSFEWTGGSTASTLEVTTAGDYVVTVTDDFNGCSSVTSITITENYTEPTASIDAPTLTLNCNVGSILLDASGSSGQGALTYFWQDGSTNPTFTAISQGTYAVTVTDLANGCSSSNSIDIFEDFASPTASISNPGTVLDCNVGSITLDATGSTGQSGLSFEWTGGGTTPFLEVTSPGTYTVTVSTGNGCDATASVTITENITEPTAVIDTPVTQLDCITGGITLDASGSSGQGTLSYAWTGGSAGPSLEVTAAGDYSVTITDSANGCTAVETITITENTSAPAILFALPTDHLDCETPSVILSASGSIGQGTLSFEWTGGSMSSTLEVTAAGDYSVTVTDSANGCSSVESVTITENFTEPVPMIDAPTTQLDCANGSITLDAAGSTGQGTLTYQWTGGSTGSTLEVTSEGDYSVTITDSANGCTAIENITITESISSPDPLITASDTQIDCDTPDILLEAVGWLQTPPGLGEYVWSTGDTTLTLTVTMAGTYSVTLTDLFNGCSAEASITISENFTQPTPNITSATTQLDCNNGTITLDASGSTGPGALSFLWNTGGGGPTPDAHYEFENNTDDSAGANNGTPQNGPTYTAGPVGQAIDLDGNNQHVTLPSGMFDTYNDFTFAAWVNWDGPASTIWERIFDFGNNTTQYMVLTPNGFPNNFRFAITTSGPGGEQRLETAALPVNEWTHVAVVLDGDTGTLYVNGSVVDSETITVDPSDIAPMLNYFGRSQFVGDSYFDGQIDDVRIFNTALSGSEINEVMSGGSTSDMLVVSTAGTYSVTVTDASNGCTAEQNITITQNFTAPTAAIDAPSTQLDCSTGSLTLDASVSTGQGTLSYEWTGGSTGATLAVSAAGNYSVTVTDAANGCTSVAMITITQDENVPTASIDAPTTQLDCNVASIILDASGSTGQNTLTYEWTGGSSNATLEVTMAGDYTVTVTDTQNGCTSSATITITENYTSPSIIWFAPTTQLDCVTGSITLDASGSTGQGTLSYEWTGGSTGATLDVPAAGEYFVTITDAANGCTSSSSITITENYTAPVADLSTSATVLDCFNGIITLDAIGSAGQGSLSYEWTDGSTNNFIVISEVGEYAVTITDAANGCTAVESVTITENFTEPTAVIDAPTTQLDCNVSSITLDATGSTGQGTLYYDWTGGSTDPTLEVTSAGDYSVTITDAANQCTSVATITITENFTNPTALIDAPATELNCEITSIELNAAVSFGQGDLGYEWTGGSTDSTLVVTTAGNYSVTVTDLVNGCSAFATQTITQDENVPTAAIDAPETQLDCNTGSITLDASGSTGQGTLTYEWTGGSTGSTLEVTAGGNYGVTITDDANGCTAQANITITENYIEPTAAIDAPMTQLDCTTGSITLDASGSTGQGTLTYEWTGGSTGSTLQVAVAGDYSVTVTDSENGCSAVATITITQDENVPTASIDAPTTQLDCNVASIILDASGSTGQNALTYEWTGGSSNATLEVTMAGDYTVTVTDTQNGCTSSATITITENYTSPSIIWFAPTTQLDCVTGSITLDASGSTGQGVLGYEWTGGSTGATLDVTAAGEYFVTITDAANGCTSSSSITITENYTAPVADLSTSATVLDCFNGIITLDAIGSAGQGTLSYGWTDGSTNNFIVISEVGEYAVTITDAANGCTAVESVTITENFTEPTAVIDAPTTQLDCNVSSITLDATGSTGQGILFYDWTGGSTDPTLEVTSAGDYSITITDAANQCTSVATITITDNFTNPTALIDAPATELTCEVTSIELNAAISFGQGDLSYEWTGGSTDSTLVVTTAGDYSVTVTDPVNGCSAVASVTITQDGNVPTAVIDAPETQLDCDTGSIILDASGSTGQGTLTYEWTGGSTGSTLEVTVAGDYGVTITDSTNGCTAEASITITENYIAPTAVIDAPATQLDCTTGSIILDASGSMGQGTLSYEWTGGSTGATLVVALAGDYSVTVTDSANGCTAVNMITITQDSDVPVAMIDTPIMELDCNVLAIILDASGSTGVNPLTYEWTGGSTNAALEVTMGGVYSVTVTDSQNGCTSATSINITENYTSPSIIWFTPTTQLDCDTGSIVVDASGSTGQGMLTYEWTGGSTGSTLEVTAAGEYFVTLTDAANGCSSSSSITITENYTTPSASIDVPTTQLDCNVASIALDASGSMGQGALTYEWTGGSTNATLDVTMVGDYFVTVSDGANGCQSVTFVSITQDLLAPNAVITPPAITLLDCNNPTITLDAGPSSGQGVLSYEWTGGGTNATLEVTSAGDYFVTVTDAQNGCTAVDMVTLTEDFMAPVVVIETPLGTQLDCDTEMLTINAGNSTGQGVLSYEWTGGSTNPSLEVTAPGNYSVTISDSQNGCTAIETIVITQDMGNVMVSYNDPVCVGDELELFNTNTATQWQWEGPDDFTSTIQNPTISQVTTAASGIYFVTITETSGCTYVGSVDVVVNTIPEINITGSEEVCEQGTIDLTEDAGDAVSWSWSGPDSFSASSGNINISMVSELQQGVYQVNITDINGCVNSDQIDIAINDLPLVEIISSSPVCTDEDLELHEVGGNAIEWSWTGPDGFTASTSDVFVSSNQVLGGTYLVTITGENGCTATAETIVSTVQGQLIESNFLVGNMACLGDSLRFIDYTNIDIDTTATFFWDFGNGDTSTERDPVYVYHTSGLFDIQLEILSGSCPNFSMVKSVGIVDCLKQPFGLINASLRPTINDGQFDIYVELIDKGDVLLEIYDVNGKKIQSDFYQNIDSLEKSITIREVGIYFVQIGHKNGVEILRAIVIE